MARGSTLIRVAALGLGRLERAMSTRRRRSNRHLVGGLLALALLALTAIPALAAIEQSARIELHFGSGCHGSGFVEYPTVAQPFPSPHREPITWRPGTTFAHDFSTGDTLRVAIIGPDGATLWEGSAPWDPPPDGSGPDFNLKAWFDCSSGTLREVAAPNTATISAIPARDLPARSPATSALLALAFAAGALLGLGRLERRGSGRRRR